MGLKELSGGLLPAMNEAMPHRLVPVLGEFLFEHAGAREVSVLLADYELRELRLLSPGDGEQLTLPVEGSSAGQCFIGQVVVSEPVAGGTAVLVPLSLRAERLGVLRVLFDEQPVEPGLLLGLAEVALATSYVLVACGSARMWWRLLGGLSRLASRRRCSGTCSRCGRSAPASSPSPAS